MKENIRIKSILTYEPGFRIRTKKDAYRFWKDIFVSGEITMRDANDQNRLITIYKEKGGYPKWSTRYRWAEWYDPEILHTGNKGAIDFAWQNRKSINAWLKEQEADDE